MGRKTKAYIVYNNTFIAEIKTDLKNGSKIKIGPYVSEEKFGLKKELVLCKSKTAKISRNKKWMGYQRVSFFYAKEIKPKEFVILCEGF
jgi:hypothetical protein